VQLVKGINYLLRGVGLATKPRIRRFVILPLIVNILLFSVAIYYSWIKFSELTMWLNNWLPAWLEWLYWLLIPLFVALVGLVIFMTFALVANIISAPFNGLLSEAVENYLTGEALPKDDAPWYSIFTEIVKSIGLSIARLSYYAMWALILLIITAIPAVNLIAPILWFLFAAWMLCVDYSSVPMDNHKIKNKTQRKLLGKKRGLSFGFGSATVGGTMIPIVNFVIMPIAVIGATIMWVEQFKKIATKPVEAAQREH